MISDYKFIYQEGGINFPKDFYSSSVSSGIKKNGELDLTLVHSKSPCISHAVFTTNKVQAAPIIISKKKMSWGKNFSAFIVNSGNANACVGKRGLKDAKEMSQNVEKNLRLLGHNNFKCAVCSTGTIGIPLPIDKIKNEIPLLIKNSNNSAKNGNESAQAIMTSDTKPKELAATVNLPIDEKSESIIKIGAMAKGAGMINPNMATMLAFITTDAKISKKALKEALKYSVENSFNKITIDGDMSTNDSVIALSNGKANNQEIQYKSREYEVFRDSLKDICEKLSMKIVSDGEKISKVITIDVFNAKNKKDAKKIANSVANSVLVKCSFAGEDANWGRVMHAIGYSGARVKQNFIDIYFGDVRVTREGIQESNIDLDKLKEIISKKFFSLKIDMNLGKENYHVITTDLTEGYVNYNLRENALFL